MGVWKHGHAVPLEPKALDVLRHLIANRDRLVTKDELLDHVWKDTFVTPNALTRAVAQLRKGLEDDVEHPRVIETVAKRGYRFVAPVTVPDDEDSDAPAELDARLNPRATNAPFSRASIAAIAIVLLAVAGLALLRARPATRAIPPLAPLADVRPLTSYGDVIDASVSLDGRYLAYVRSAQGKQSLWIRQLHGTNPIELVPPSAVSYFGLSFAPDAATIYYVVRGPEPLAFPTGMLFQIPALGGAPRRLGTAFDHHPSVSPDGRQLASLRANFPTPRQSALLVANADGTGARTLLTADEPESFAPGFFIAPTWSPDGSRIAAAIRNADGWSARLLTVDVKSGAIHRFDTVFTTATFAAWLQDGTGIAFIAANKNDPTVEYGSRVWIQPLPDGTPRPLTSGVVEYRNVSATADSSTLVSVGSIQNGTLWRVALDGAAKLQKIPAMKDDGAAGAAWLDADTLVFTSLDGGVLQIWTMHADGSARRQITTEGWNLWPRPSTDGRTIYFVSDRDNVSGGSGIWRMNRDGTDPRRVANAVEARDLTLTSDGRTLLFTAPDANRIDSTWTVPVGGGTPQLLLTGLIRAAVSPDGRSIAGIWQPRADASPVLAVFPIAGGAPVKVFDGSFPGIAFGGVWWSRDGRALLHTISDRTNLWRQPIAGGAAVAVTDFADGFVTRGEPSPDGRAFLMVRGNPIRDAFLITGFR